jgi:putative transposase
MRLSGMECEKHLNMPRRHLAGSGGFVFHVMNRSAKQLTLFDRPFEYEMFLQVLAEADSACPMRLLEYCVMPNHWHLLVWPERDDQLSRYMRWITGVHAQRWRQARGQPGKGAVYQGRYRWVAVQSGEHYDVARCYIQQNPVRAHLVECQDEWPWSSASCKPVPARPTLASGPRSSDPRLEHPIDRPLDAKTAQAMRASLRSGQPFGDPQWCLALEVRTWLTAVLAEHSKAQAVGRVKNTNESPEVRV